MEEYTKIKNYIANDKKTKCILKLIEDWLHLNPNSDFNTALREAILFYIWWGWLFCNTSE